MHLAIAAHVTHFLVARRTLSPVEPSESMYTLELGQLNAGFLFFLVALAATLVVGRFFCGWGCHIVALQDLCAWLMKKMGVRPRPFRSRLLLWAPLVVALYMFVWPAAKRWLGLSPAPFPGLSNHLLTTDYWATFPGPLFAALTFLTCGFAAVYVLGAKGFCTYGCPYGGLFALVDRLSPGRIVVDEGCEQCGHCTATCTSNVRVHEEVRRYGRVVDPGCMKCMDCVSVCPKGALRFSFARPALFGPAPVGPARDRTFDLGLGEELLLGATCIVATLSFRGLYDGPPLLMSVGLGGLTAYGALQLWHLWRRPNVRLQQLQLKHAGRMRRAGWAVALLVGGWLVFTLHSGYVQWHRLRGSQLLARTGTTWEQVLGGARVESPAHRAAAAASLRHFALAERWGLFDVLEVRLGVAWGELLAGNGAAAEAELRAAIGLAPANRELRQRLVELLVSRHQLAAAIEAQQELSDDGEATAVDHFRLGGLLAEAGRYEEAAGSYRACLDRGGNMPETHFNLGGVLRRMGRSAEAVAELEIARDLAPQDHDTRIELALAYLDRGEPSRARTELARALELHPDSPEARLQLEALAARE